MDGISATEPLIVRRLGRVPYGEALQLQERLRRERMEGRGSDTVLLLEHPDVITFGRRSRPENALLSEAALRAAGRLGEVETWSGIRWTPPCNLSP